MSFLDHLPAPLSERSRQFFAAWHSWRKADEIPERSHLEFGLGELKSTAMMLEARGRDDMPMVFVGPVFTERLGIDLTGINYLDMTRTEEHTSELQSLMRTSYAVFCLKKKKYTDTNVQTKPK